MGDAFAFRIWCSMPLMRRWTASTALNASSVTSAMVLYRMADCSVSLIVIGISL
jgi:hypothetical protein